MYILGISAFYHDSAACLIKDGEIIAAVQEERFTRIKHFSGFPHLSIKYCLKEANINGDEISNVVFYEKPFLKFERLFETYLAFAPRGFLSFLKSMPIWIKNKIFQKLQLVKELKKSLGDTVEWKHRLLFSEHHLSHAASAYYPSPFESAAILTIDGVGEWTTTSLAVGEGSIISNIKSINFPHSLGLLYSAFTYYIGFKVNSGEYKLMGLAPYGSPKYINLIKQNLITVADDGSFKLNMQYFDFATGLKMTNNKFNKLFGAPPRKPESKITQREMDIAASIQKVTEEILVKLAKDIAYVTGRRNLCLAGGVALNCVANGILLKEKVFDNIWIQPAAGDAGGSLGAALSIWYLHYKNKRKISSGKDSMKGSYLGPDFEDNQIENELNLCGAVYEKLSDNELINKVVASLINQKAVGLMNGRMEFGPRALGARSIIADPRSAQMQKQLNLKVKFRESFRPFAPSIINEEVNEWFDQHVDSPYMLFVSNVKKNKLLKVKDDDLLIGFDKLKMPRSLVPAVTHIDNSARIQTVDNETNPKFYSIIKNFFKKTGCPMIVNTSFNIRGEPIVCTPTDAFNCFMGTELDLLVINNYLIYKNKQNKDNLHSYKNKFNLD